MSKFLRATDSDGGAITYSLDDAMPDTDYFKLLQEDSSVIVVNDCPGDDCLDREVRKGGKWEGHALLSCILTIFANFCRLLATSL